MDDLEELVRSFAHPKQKITRDDNGIVHIDPKDQNDLICDFCDESPVTDVFYAAIAKTQIGAAISRTDEGWAACSECGSLIKQNLRSALADRAAHQFQGMVPGLSLSRARRLAAEVQAIFWKNRIRSN